MPRIPNNSVPTGEIVRELAGKTINTESRTSADYVVTRTMMLPLQTGTSSGIVLAVQNPESYPLIIRQATLIVLTEAQTSASVDIGIVASSSKSASDLFKGAAASPPGTLGNFVLLPGYLPTAGSGSSGIALLPAGISKWEKNGFSSDSWLTMKLTLGTGSSLAGYLMLEVVPLFST